MRNRVAFIFVSSPNSVTPVHFDIEHSLLMQVSGCKTVSIGAFESDAARRHEVDRYWDGSHGRMEAVPQELATYPLTPGGGVYIPPGTPHWVHNGPDISISVTLTYFTAATVRENRIEDFNFATATTSSEPSNTRAVFHSSTPPRSPPSGAGHSLGGCVQVSQPPQIAGTEPERLSPPAGSRGARVSPEPRRLRPVRTQRTANCVALDVVALEAQATRPHAPLACDQSEHLSLVWSEPVLVRTLRLGESPPR